MPELRRSSMGIRELFLIYVINLPDPFLRFSRLYTLAAKKSVSGGAFTHSRNESMSINVIQLIQLAQPRRHWLPH